MPFQMALDELIFRCPNREAPILRFYYSSEPWISIGYSHAYEPSNGTPVCKRITGGGEVLHGKDLIFSISASKSDDESFKSVRQSYLKIHEAVKLAFKNRGKELRFYRCDENLPKGKDCFVYPIATDLALGNQKIAGGSQKRSGALLLHQESIQDCHSLAAEDLMQELQKAFAEIFEMKWESLDLAPELLREARKLAKEKYERV